MTAGYDRVIAWLESDIRKAQGEMKLGEEVTVVEIAGEDEGMTLSLNYHHEHARRTLTDLSFQTHTSK